MLDGENMGGDLGLSLAMTQGFRGGLLMIMGNISRVKYTISFPLFSFVYLFSDDDFFVVKL